MTAALHRVSQFWRHASARVTPRERADAERILGPLAGFFRELPDNDQRHGLDVLDTLRRFEAVPEPLLQQAALLHDMGKREARFSVVERSLTVMLRSVSRHALKAWLKSRPGLARRYAIYQDHARIGADRLRAAGAPELAAIVAEHHATSPQAELTRRLQRADGHN